MVTEIPQLHSAGGAPVPGGTQPGWSCRLTPNLTAFPPRSPREVLGSCDGDQYCGCPVARLSACWQVWGLDAGGARSPCQPPGIGDRKSPPPPPIVPGCGGREERPGARLQPPVDQGRRPVGLVPPAADARRGLVASLSPAIPPREKAPSHSGQTGRRDGRSPVTRLIRGGAGVISYSSGR